MNRGKWYFSVIRYRTSFCILPALTFSWNKDLWCMLTLHWLVFSASVERWLF